MKLSDLLVDAWVVAPLAAEDLGGALQALIGRVAAEGGITQPRARKLARDLAFGTQGEIVRVNERVVMAVAGVEGLRRPGWGIGVSPEPLRITAEGRIEPGTARAVLLVLAGRKSTPMRRDVVRALARALRDHPGRTERLLEARSAEDVRLMEGFMQTELYPRLVVDDAMIPVRYRVYPDTPLREVVDLMVRRGVHAVPVVGERYEVLGILTAGDALAWVLRGSGGARAEARGGRKTKKVEEPTARDLMTRSVLCVSEEQSLSEAANMMVNRDVEQIPVVREGELVGFVTRDSILRALYGTLPPEPNREEESEADP